ncbi:MAG: nucleotidyl transferase AbiEii/AbiGii toxin family protein [Bacteroidota bacterium]
MIPQAYITQWRNQVPWQTNEQVEQDLVICRALVEIFKDDYLAESLAFRGGSALHKIYLYPQPRYSEDIDLVQIRPEPIKETIHRLQKALKFLGKSNVQPRKDNNTVYFRFESEFPPVQMMKLKVETNCREHFSVLGWDKKHFSVQSDWFHGECHLTTYSLEELLGTKLRALYQRKKGRDLYDLWKAMTTAHADPRRVIHCYHEYMTFSLKKAAPNRKQFLMNLEAKRADSEFSGDTKALLRPEETYDQESAFELVIERLVKLM